MPIGHAKCLFYLKLIFLMSLIAALIFSAGYYSAPIFFTTRRGVLVFSRSFFLQEVDLFTRHFDLKAKVRKAVSVNRFSLSERSFLIMRFVVNDFLTLKSSF